MIAACSSELAVKEAFADVDFLQRFIDFKRVAKSTAVAGNADLFVTCKTALDSIVICKITDTVIKERERLGSKFHGGDIRCAADVERGVKARFLAAAFKHAAVFAARGVFVVEDRECLVERGVASVRSGRHAGGGGGRVNTQTVFSVPLIAPAERVDRISPCEREIGDSVVIENGILFFLVIDLCAVNADLIAGKRNRNAAALLFDISAN